MAFVEIAGKANIPASFIPALSPKCFMRHKSFPQTMNWLSEMTKNKSNSKTPFSPHSAVLFSILFCVFGAFIVTVVEFRSYKNKFLRLKAMDTSLFDTGLVFWSLLVKTLILLLPLFAVVAFLLYLKKNKTSFSILYLGVLLLFGWLVADVRLMRFTGGHLSQYLENILNPLAWQWGSDLSRLYWQMGWDLFIAVASITGLFLFLYTLIKRFQSRTELSSQKRMLYSASCPCSR